MKVMQKRTRHKDKCTISLQESEIDNLLLAKYDQLVITCDFTGDVLKVVVKAQFRALLSTCVRIPLTDEYGRFKGMSTYFVAKYNF